MSMSICVYITCMPICVMQFHGLWMTECVLASGMLMPCTSPECTDVHAQPCADLATCAQRWCQVGGSGLPHLLEPAKT